MQVHCSSILRLLYWKKLMEDKYYAVMIEVDFNEYTYVCKRNPFKLGDPVKLFYTKEEAQVEADKWNTGEVVEYGRKKIT